MLNIKLPVLYRPLNYLLLLIIAILLLRLIWLALMPTEKILSSASVVKVSPDLQIQTKPPLAASHLFGIYQQKQAVSQYRNAPETSLNLLLRGIVSGETDQDGFAIIRNSKGREAVYRVGGELPGGGEVRGVFPDRVVLFRQGRYETLRLRLDESTLPDAGSGFVVRDKPVAGTGSATATKMPLSAGSMPTARSRYALNVSAMASSYGLVKIPAGGYRISLGRNAKQLVKLGLRNGDVIVSANGVKLDDEAAVESLITEVMQGKGLSLEILRHGQKQILQPDLNNLQP